MVDQAARPTKKEKYTAVAEYAMLPENAPPGYVVKVILARGGLYSTIKKLTK
ncbi:unnamed protein product [marine sediment metagenome]|uniref:Uncharacterized protein n=1 Tax=marine sediment metagenome TaxID=412755 RepID=X0Z5B5_9ZZZZ